MQALLHLVIVVYLSRSAGLVPFSENSAVRSPITVNFSRGLTSELNESAYSTGRDIQFIVYD